MTVEVSRLTVTRAVDNVMMNANGRTPGREHARAARTVEWSATYPRAGCPPADDTLVPSPGDSPIVTAQLPVVRPGHEPGVFPATAKPVFALNPERAVEPWTGKVLQGPGTVTPRRGTQDVAAIWFIARRSGADRLPRSVVAAQVRVGVPVPGRRGTGVRNRVAGPGMEVLVLPVAGVVTKAGHAQFAPWSRTSCTRPGSGYVVEPVSK